MKKLFTSSLVAAFALAWATESSAAVIATLPSTAQAKTYVFSGYMFTTFWGSTFGYEEDMLPNEVAFDGNDVYWKDPTQNGHVSYLKGVKDGNQIKFEFPQEIDLSLRYNSMERVSASTAAPLYNVSSTNVISFTITDDGHLVMNNSDEEGLLIIGETTSSGAWRSKGVYAVDLKPFSQTLAQVPASAEVSKMILNYQGGSREVSVAVDGNTYYVQGLFANSLNVWAKGVLSDGKISFESGQYMGPDPETGWMTFLYGSVVEEKYSDDLGYYNSNTLQDAFVMTLNAETGAMTAVNNLQICPGEKYKDLPSFAPVKDITIVKQTEITDFTPAAPKITDVMTYPSYPGQGWDYVDVNISDVNTEGQMLDQSKIYYRIFLDGKPYILDPDDFDGIDEKMEWIPFNFECYDLEKIGGTGRSVSIYAENYNLVGVQEKYVDGDKEYLSEICVWNIELGGIEGVDSIVAEKADVVDVYYTNLEGQRVSEPARGFYIKTSVLANGKKINKKILVK